MILAPTEQLAPAAFEFRHRHGDATKKHAVPEQLRRFVLPAEWFIYEWTLYVVVCPGATRLQTGSTWQMPIAPGVFEFSFENQLGLTTIRAFDGFGPVSEPVHVEVIASKFTNPTRSVDFLRTTLADLFARVAASPFALTAANERMVRE